MKKGNAFTLRPFHLSKRERASLKSLAAKTRVALDALNAGDRELSRHRLQREKIAEKIAAIENGPDAVAESGRLPALREEEYFHFRRITELEEKLKADPRLKLLQEPLAALGQAFSKVMRRWFDGVERGWSVVLAPLSHGDVADARERLKQFPTHNAVSSACIVAPRSWGNGSGLSLDADYALHLISQVLAGKNPWSIFFTDTRPIAQ